MKTSLKKLKKACINLIIDNALNTDDKDFYIATLLIHGLGGKNLNSMSLKELLNEVWEGWEYSFDGKELETLSDNETLFKEWILKKSLSVKDWEGQLNG